MRATIDGQKEFGALGVIPVIRVAGKKPKFVNNGWACFSGQPDLEVPGLAEAPPDEGRSLRQGHVCLQYDDGQFLTYTSTIRGNGIYSFN